MARSVGMASAMRRPSIRASRVLFWAVAVMAVLYVPLAVSYMWHFFDAGAPRLQDSLTAAINGREYAVGEHSVMWARGHDYGSHRVVMLLHTSLGGLALGLSMLQFSGRLRTRRPRVHRRVGRAYLALMTASMLFAITFLVLSAPVDYTGGTGFDLQLWALAGATLFSGWYALFAIRRRDVITHRAWMSMSIAFMMTAPLLRVVWIGLAPVLPDADLLMNLGAGAIMLGVVAPAGAAVAFMLTHRARQTTPGRVPAGRRNAGLVALAALGSVAFVLRFQPLPDAIPASIPALHVIPAWGYLAICAAGAHAARRNQDAVRERRWSWLMTGAAAAPITSVIVGIIAGVVYGPVDGYMVGPMVGAPVPIMLTFALVVHQASRRRPAPQRVDPRRRPVAPDRTPEPPNTHDTPHPEPSLGGSAIPAFEPEPVP